MVSSSAKIGLSFAILSVLVFYYINILFTVTPIPDYKEEWWGPGEPRQVDESIRPFRINVSEEILEDLRYRLEKTLPLQKPLEGVKQHYGMNGNLLQTVIDFWKTDYNWREREKFLNKYPHFLVNIQGLDIHFIHVKPKAPKNVKVLPMLVLHGWLGSVREMYELIPLLTTPQGGRDIVFELIVPSLPGFFYSDGASKPGLSAFHMAVIMKNLMLKNGFDKFYVQGTDWGGSIVRHMSILFPNKIIAMHSNFCLVNGPISSLKFLFYSIYPSLFVEEEHQELMFPLSKIWSFRMLEGGYFHIQATKPDTVGVALRESPAGLAAYLLEKFTTLTNPAFKDLEDGGLTQKYSMTTLIDNIMLYWITRSITTSTRIYAEQFLKTNRQFSTDNHPVMVPSACTRFKYDVFFYPESILRDGYKQLLQVTYYEGGHFPALEVPDILAEDIFNFVDKVRKMQATNKT